MRFTARFAATLAITLSMVIAVRADDRTQPNAKPKPGEDSLATSAPKPLFPAKPAPKTATPAPAPAPARQHRGEEHRYPKVEWFFGYSFWRAMPTATTNRMGYLDGGSTSVAFNFNRYLGLVADFGGYDDNKLTLLGPTGHLNLNSDGSAYTYMFGPRFSYRRSEIFTPFAEALFGGTYATAVTISGCNAGPVCTPLGSQNAFTAAFGLGLDIKLSRHFALRLFDADFLLTRFRNPFSAGGLVPGWQKNARFSSGLVFRFGGMASDAALPTPMLGTCSAEKDSVYAGSGDFVSIHAHASSVDNYPVNYSWSVNEGTVDGTGPDVRWNSSNRRPGDYAVRAHMENGRNGVADCSVNIRVAPRPNRSPSMTCSADRSSVTVGQPVAITASANDPDNDALSFAWRADSGRIEGQGADVRFQTFGLAPGSYTINGRVDDGRAGTADCAVNVDVQAAQIVQPPAEVRELESRLALHSLYFPTARPTVQHPEAGLVPSQEEVLVALAADFVRYLTFRSDAHLTLEGHADRRGAVEYNQQLTERRVERTKSFLIAHGVPAASIETRAFGKQQNLDSAQVQQLVDNNPDLTSDERQKIDANLIVIVMANNRRVDVTLDTTGQQSVRQYPFNAKDSLTLLSPAGASGDKRPSAPARKKPVTPQQ